MKLNAMLGVMAALLAVISSPAHSHHSFAVFDLSKTVVFKGTLKDLQWTNPHVLIWVETDPSAGKAAETWTAELTSPGNLTRLGWTKRSLKPGDRVEVVVNPLRDGSHGGGFQKATLVSTGQVLTSNLRAAVTTGAKP